MLDLFAEACLGYLSNICVTEIVNGWKQKPKRRVKNHFYSPNIANFSTATIMEKHYRLKQIGISCNALILHYITEY